MKVIRRICFAAVVVLGLSLPLPAAPANAHTGAGWATEFGYRSGDGGVVLAGLVTNHTSSRQKDIMVTATWRIGDAVVASETTTAFIDNLAIHAATPFRLVETQNVVGATPTVTVSATATLVWPNAPLSVDPGTISVDTYTGVVNNVSEVTAENVRVFAVRRLGGIIVDAAQSASIATIPAFASAAYTIEFDNFSGDAVGSLSAESGGGTYVHTSWNNWFNDLGGSNFAAEIAFLADEGITFGCGVLAFCPKSPVTREQMAVFLDRALDLPTAVGDHPFTDIGGRPEYAQQAIANVYEAGIAGGCTATTFCPIAPVTRGQMSKFIVLGYGLTPIAGPGLFTDDNGHFSEPYNNRMAADGITSGCTATTYCPHASVLREQMAKFLFEAEN